MARQDAVHRDGCRPGVLAGEWIGGSERQTTSEPGVAVMPVQHSIFAQLPAEIHRLPVAIGSEIAQPGPHILDHDLQRLDFANRIDQAAASRLR